MRSGKKKHSQIGAINAFGGENCEFFSARRWFENCLKRMAELRKINWIKYRFRHMARKFAALNPVGLLCVELKVARTNRIKNTDSVSIIRTMQASYSLWMRTLVMLRDDCLQHFLEILRYSLHLLFILWFVECSTETINRLF